MTGRAAGGLYETDRIGVEILHVVTGLGGITATMSPMVKSQTAERPRQGRYLWPEVLAAEQITMTEYDGVGPLARLLVMQPNTVGQDGVQDDLRLTPCRTTLARVQGQRACLRHHCLCRVSSRAIISDRDRSWFANATIR